ncbi:MAG TPA: hypothetical protein VGS12_09460 [Caulobacteraceae bacterium]|nr:hypothetical protein [Caulobacteraceae bacterium]
MNRTIDYLFTRNNELASEAFAAYIGSAPDKFGTGGSAINRAIFDVLCLNICVNAVITHVLVRPDVPPVVAVEHILAALVGDEAFSDDAKQFTGWRIRQIVEFLGGRWVRAGVRVRGSRFRTGSIYRMPEAARLLAA